MSHIILMPGGYKNVAENDNILLDGYIDWF
jgi:hypothetical protein